MNALGSCVHVTCKGAVTFGIVQGSFLCLMIVCQRLSSLTQYNPLQTYIVSKRLPASDPRNLQAHSRPFQLIHFEGAFSVNGIYRLCVQCCTCPFSGDTNNSFTLMRSSQPSSVGSTVDGSDKSTTITTTEVVTCLGFRKPASPCAKSSANSLLPPTCVQDIFCHVWCKGPDWCKALPLWAVHPDVWQGHSCLDLQGFQELQESALSMAEKVQN
eukprot:1159989-Pelagomonas_calceolata.AAC.1